jgi:hypothetical protein
LGKWPDLLSMSGFPGYLRNAAFYSPRFQISDAKLLRLYYWAGTKLHGLSIYLDRILERYE